MRSLLRDLVRFRLRRRDFLHATGLGVLGTVASPARAEETGAPPEYWTSYFRSKLVWGYIDKHSVSAGEPFALMLSTAPAQPPRRGVVEFFRVGADGLRPTWRSPPVDVAAQSSLHGAAAAGLHWPPSLDAIDTARWPPGVYSADFVHEDTQIREPQIAQLIVRNPRRDGRVLLKLCTNTYQAYNAWGGHSLYPTETDRRGAMVSFDRPCGPAFFEYDVYLARWLEGLGARDGFGVDYVSDFDVHRDPEQVLAYPLVATGAHDEYWSKEEFDIVERRVFEAGRNTIFFGANTAYFQVRYADLHRPPGDEDRGRQMICFKSMDDPVVRRSPAAQPELLATARFRDGGRRPETMLAGVAYQDWFPADAPGVPYLVASTDAPFFAGTGLRPGDVAADVVGYEWDNRDPEGDGRRLWDPARSRNRLLPAERLKVLFTGTASGEKTRNGRAEAVYFESPAGAKVFSTGSIRWCWGLGKEGFVREPFRRFNENLVRAFLAG